MPPESLTQCNVARRLKVPGKGHFSWFNVYSILSRILGYLGFSQGPLGAATPEEARGEVNNRSPQGEQGARRASSSPCCWVISSAASSACSTKPTAFSSVSVERYSDEGTRNIARAFVGISLHAHGAK